MPGDRVLQEDGGRQSWPRQKEQQGGRQWRKPQKKGTVCVEEGWRRRSVPAQHVLVVGGGGGRRQRPRRAGRQGPVPAFGGRGGFSASRLGMHTQRLSKGCNALMLHFVSDLESGDMCVSVSVYACSLIHSILLRLLFISAKECRRTMACHL